MAEDSIELVAYRPEWPGMARQEINALERLISDENLVAVEHVGSTSIPHALAKPVIDLYVAVHSIEVAKQCSIASIISLGYVYWEENPNPEKMFFVKGMPPYGEGRTHHIHLVEADSGYWRDTLAFRDYLRNHPEDVMRYNELKMKLAEKHRLDREAYTDAKGAFVREILRRAG